MADSGNPALPLVAKPEVFATLSPRPPEGDVDAFIEYQVKLWKVLGSPGYPTDEQAIREMVERECSVPMISLLWHAIKPRRSSVILMHNGYLIKKNSRLNPWGESSPILWLNEFTTGLDPWSRRCQRVVTAYEQDH